MAAATVAAIGLAVAGMNPTAASTTRIFYLTAKTGHCYIAGSTSAKTFVSVPCSNPRHTLEIYWTGHGGWGNTTPSPATAARRARQVCISQYERINHGAYKSYSLFYADPGKEAAKYHDHIVCAHSTYPKLHPLGAGWHVRS